ncbi:TetR/AcrR family transcriptional regulator [Streptomyces oceani]|uniref:TetR family transcriptional regulator n=1 Tax=Streptomyces oceani TaxID=1075402 RepID=A0A1E7KMG1_9ACTN|nr:TetR/AcrR family transcriptional regulator [Streptomyces oceani]OEV05103.1 TetR family transcriptional regulator [Streptomyces oceani]
MAQEKASASSRDRIVAAAVAMIAEDAGASLSVRAVAARAGVSTGSLRHFFPTQRALRDEVLARIYDEVASEGWSQDPALPARDRLVDCLRQVLAPAGVGGQAREAWGKVYEAFIVPEPTDEVRAAYLAMEQEGQRRVESWLAGLTREGALAPGDNTRRARFLMTVLNGLATERALPARESILASETETLYMAVDCVLSSGA